jgi:hypothetical protein
MKEFRNQFNQSTIKSWRASKISLNSAPYQFNESFSSNDSPRMSGRSINRRATSDRRGSNSMPNGLDSNRQRNSNSKQKSKNKNSSSNKLSRSNENFADSNQLVSSSSGFIAGSAKNNKRSTSNHKRSSSGGGVGGGDDDDDRSHLQSYSSAPHLNSDRQRNKKNNQLSRNSLEVQSLTDDSDDD